MQIARPAAAGTSGKPTNKMPRGLCREGCNLLVPDTDTFDLALAAKRVGEPVQAIPNNAINPFDASRREDFCELIGDRPSYFLVPKCVGS